MTLFLAKKLCKKKRVASRLEGVWFLSKYKINKEELSQNPSSNFSLSFFQYISLDNFDIS